MLDCLVCHRSLPPALDKDYHNPYGGTIFVARGNYGSTVFDPFDDTFLQIIICDDCLADAGKAGRVLLGSPRRVHRETDYSPWVIKFQKQEEISSQEE